MNINYNPESGLASLQGEGGINVATIVSRPGRSLATDTAFLLASYSRRKESLIEIMNSSSLLSGGNDEALEGAKRIIDGYGHGSVRGLGHLVGFIEGVSILTGMSIFNFLPLQDGQEISTRYVDMGRSMTDNCVPLNPIYSEELKAGYREILQHWADSYTHLLPKTEEALRTVFSIQGDEGKGVLKARAFDVARYFIPLAYKTRMGLIQSGREWSRLIQHLASSGGWVENENQLLAGALTTLFTQREGDYIPEGETLIRHIERKENPTRALLSNMSLSKTDIDLWEWEDGDPPTRYMFEDDSVYFRYALLKYPHIRDAASPTGEGYSFLRTLWDAYDHQTEAPVQCRAGKHSIHGKADIGSLKDLNRHRDMLYLPFLDEEFNVLEDILLSGGEAPYSLCPYLYIDHPLMRELRREYIERMDKGYELLIAWIEKTHHGVLSDDIRRDIQRYVKLLLPQGHQTPYILSGSAARWNYLCNLRVRNGGHIAYRSLAQRFAKKLVEADPYEFTGFFHGEEVCVEDKAQFLDRS